MLGGFYVDYYSNNDEIITLFGIEFLKNGKPMEFKDIPPDLYSQIYNEIKKI